MAFGCVVDQLWYDYGAGADRDRYTYGYDRSGNRLYRENTITSGKDEFNSYDQINRLVNFDRGDLNVGKTAITGTPVREEDFTLDMTGNWTAFVQKTAGTTDLDQDRTHNKVNEIINITETTGAAWVTPVEDRNGNMTTVPKPSSLASGLTLTYDAWNRLAEVKDGRNVVGKYEYDGLNRRVKKHLDSQSPSNPNASTPTSTTFTIRRGKSSKPGKPPPRATSPKTSNPNTNTSGAPATSTPPSSATKTPTRTFCATTSGSTT